MYPVPVDVPAGAVIDGLHNGTVPEPCGLCQALDLAVVPIVPFGLYQIGHQFIVGIVHALGREAGVKGPEHPVEPELFHLFQCLCVHVVCFNVCHL